jgi:nicotinate phosphoribosyltransferase
VRIVVSGGLDEHRIADLVAAGAPVDVAGIGTRLGVSADAPYLDTVYKLVAYDGRPVAKLSASKETLPGAKQVFRAPGLVDVIGMREETAPANTEPLLEMVMAGGHPIGPAAPLSELRTRFESDLAELPEAARALDSPVAPHVPITPALSALTRRVHGAARRNLHIAEGPTTGTGMGVGL